MKLDSLIYVARETISILDEFPDLTFSHAEISTAAKAGQLVDHLNKRFREKPHLPVLLGKVDECLAVNHAIRRAAEAMERHENRRIKIKRSGTDLLIALILDAIRQHYVDPCPVVTLRH
jgi:hypothetical protein